MERQPYNNLWAEKLLQVSMPDGGEAWTDMEAILDRQMPRRFWGDGRRWLLLILLLLLLIGVCNCPGRGRLFHGSGTRAGGPVMTPDGAGSATRRIPPGPVLPPAPATPVIRSSPVSPAATVAPPRTGPAAPAPTPGAITSHPATITAGHGSRESHSTIHGAVLLTHKGAVSHRKRPRIMTHTPGEPAAYDDIIRTETDDDARRTRTEKTGSVSKKTSGKPQLPAGDATAKNDVTVRASTQAGPRKDSTAKKDSTVAALTKTGPRKDTAVRKDSAARQNKKPSPPPQEHDEKEKDHGWVIGVGLNQFFPVGGQRGSTYNSNGLTGTLTDYLPVPMVRYYLNRKTYLQLEAQFNTPQPTAKNLVISAPFPDTSTTNGITTRIVSSASIQQLYYFNIPLSLHYNPWDNLNLGIGVQWSHLSNAIGEFDSTTTTNPNTGNTSNITTAKADVTRSFKDDALYRTIKTNELRFLVDVNYSYKHFVLGLRYNQALSKFINVQLPTGGTTQARNSSLQLYLRYILWDTRKKKAQATR